MKEIFCEILNLSLSAAYLVPVVLVLRLVLKKAPRWTMCLLWGLVALRLVMPFSLESDVSLHPGREPIADLQTQWGGDTQPDTLPEVQPEPLPEAPSVTPAPTPAEELDLMEILGWVWLAGACAMALYGAVSYVRLKLKVRPSLQVEKRVFVCDGIGYPFLLGVLRPNVYLPSDLEEPHLSYVLAHEKAHVKRGDHLWKPLGFALLTLHWFNPLLWVAYLLLCRDIESACDEKVVRDMDNTQKDGYSRALLACSMQGAFHRRWISACPVAFGETGVKTRIKSVLHYKKPAFWVLLVAVLACIAVGVFFLTDPAGEESGIPILQNSHIIPLDDHLPVELTTEDFPGVIFRVTKNHRLEIQSAGETKTLDVLREIFFFALADASGDGLADVCVSGYQDETREKACGFVYDYANDVYLEIKGVEAFSGWCFADSEQFLWLQTIEGDAHYFGPVTREGDGLTYQKQYRLMGMYTSEYESGRVSALYMVQKQEEKLFGWFFSEDDETEQIKGRWKLQDDRLELLAEDENRRAVFRKTKDGWTYLPEESFGEFPFAVELLRATWVDSTLSVPSQEEPEETSQDSSSESSEDKESYTVEGVYGDGVELLSREVVEYSEGALYRYMEYAVAVDGEILYVSEQGMQIREEYGYLRVLGNESNALLTLQGEEIFPLGMYDFIVITGEWLTANPPEGGSVIYRLQEGEWKEFYRSEERRYYYELTCNGIAQFGCAEGSLLVAKDWMSFRDIPFGEDLKANEDKLEDFAREFYAVLRECDEQNYQALLPYLPLYAEDILAETEIPQYADPMELHGYELLLWTLRYSHRLSEKCDPNKDWQLCCTDVGGTSEGFLEFSCGEHDFWIGFGLTAKSNGSYYVSNFEGALA